jgi:hypothetical protein
MIFLDFLEKTSELDGSVGDWSNDTIYYIIFNTLRAGRYFENSVYEEEYVSQLGNLLERFPGFCADTSFSLYEKLLSITEGKIDQEKIKRACWK